MSINYNDNILYSTLIEYSVFGCHLKTLNIQEAITRCYSYASYPQDCNTECKRNDNLNINDFAEEKDFESARSIIKTDN